MKPETLIQQLSIINQLKDTTRHSWTKAGRQESVAEHTFSMCAAAYFLRKEFPDIDMDRVISMCLFHDIGEAFTGDIPAFDKQEHHEVKEQNCVNAWLMALPEEIRDDLSDLCKEMEEMRTAEAKLYKALDKMDALIMHNEADISTWLPLEYDLNLTYGREQVAPFPFMQAMRAACNQDTLSKINQEKEKQENLQLD